MDDDNDYGGSEMIDIEEDPEFPAGGLSARNHSMESMLGSVDADESKRDEGDVEL